MDSPLTIGAFAVSVTALAKSWGVRGNILQLVCVLAGALATYMTTYQPQLWGSLSEILGALTGTGLVALANDFLQKTKE